MKVGVLALQGDVREHLEVFRALDAAAVPVKTAADLETVEAMVLPGGESTTIGYLLSERGMIDPLRKRLHEGMPALGTCAGTIVLAREVLGGDVPKLGVLDAVVHRNAYGRQVDSFEGTVAVRDVGDVGAIFIRAPIVGSVGEAVDVLARDDRDHPVVLRQGRILAATFHPEIAGETRLHRYFLDEVCG